MFRFNQSITQHSNLFADKAISDGSTYDTIIGLMKDNSSLT